MYKSVREEREADVVYTRETQAKSAGRSLSRRVSLQRVQGGSIS